MRYPPLQTSVVYSRCSNDNDCVHNNDYHVMYTCQSVRYHNYNTQERTSKRILYRSMCAHKVEMEYIACTLVYFQKYFKLLLRNILQATATLNSK